MDRKVIPNIVLEGVKIKYRNLRGEAGPYNRAGERSFSVIIPDEEFAHKLKEDGWNVKSRTVNSDGDIEWTLPVAVAYHTKDNMPVRTPPRIYIIADDVKTELGEDDVKQVDIADIRSVDLTIRPYAWETATGHGIKAYLKNMYVEVAVDKLDQKWGHMEHKDSCEAFVDNGDSDGELPF